MTLGAVLASGCVTAERAISDYSLELRFVEVEKGDAVLLRLPDGRAVLYDGGKPRRGLVSVLQAAGVVSLPLVIASHGHSDHVGGLAEVIRHYRPQYVVTNGLPHGTRRFYELLAAVEASGATVLSPARGTLRLGDLALHVLPPPGDTSWGQNNNSIGVIAEFGNFRASLFGDAEDSLHTWWLDRYAGLLGGVTVHKASHHGRRRGDIRAMVERLRPEIVVVSVEPGRPPHPSSLALYESVGARVFRTDRHGTVIVRAQATGSYDVHWDRQNRSVRSTAGVAMVEAVSGSPGDYVPQAPLPHLR